MASLLGWFNNKIQQDVVQPYQRDIVAPVQHAVGAVVNSAPIQGLRQADSSIINTPQNLVRLGAADITNNQIARQNAFNALAPALHTAQSFARIAPEAINTIGHPFTQHTYQPTGIAKTAFGSTPIQNIQKKVANNYDTHPNLNPFARVGLAGLEGIGSIAQDAPVVGGGAKLIAKGARATEKVSKALDTTNIGRKLNSVPIGLSTKNVKSSPITPDEVAAAKRVVGETPPTQGVKPKVPTTTLTPADIKSLQKQGFTDAAIAKMRGPQGEPVSTTPPPPTVPVKTAAPAPRTPITLPEQTTKIPRAVKELASKTTLLKKIGTPSSNNLASRMTAIDNLNTTLRAISKNKMPTVFSLSKKEFQNLGEHITSGGSVAPLNDKVVQAAKEAGPTLADIHQAGTKAGLKVGNLQNYFPGDYSNLKPGTQDYNKAIQQLVNSGRAKDIPTAMDMIDQVSPHVKPSFFGNFDRPRNVTPTVFTKDALQKYINGASEKTAQATHFGPNGEISKKLIAQVAQEGGDSRLAKEAVGNYMKDASAGKSDVVAPVRGVFSAARLGKAPISHAGQTTNIGLVARGSDLAVGWAKYLSRNSDALKTVRESDVNNPANIHGLARQETSVKGVLNKITAAGLSPVMRMNRSVAAIAGERYGNWLAAKGNVSRLSELGVTGDIGKTLTRNQQLQAARGITKETMFSPSRAETPLHAETPTGKTIGQYRTAYTYKQTGLLWDKVFKAAANGDLKPLGKFLALSAPVGAGTVAIKNKISGRKEGPGGMAMDALGALGGIPGELAVQTGRYAKRDVTKTVAGMVAPVAGEAVDLGSRIQKAFGGKPQQLEKYATGLIPVVGNRVSNKLFPSNPPVVADNSGSTGSPAQRKANATAERKALEKNAGNGFTLQQTSDGKYAYTLDGDPTVYHTDSKQKAMNAVGEAQFKAEGGSYKIVGDTVYRKALDGTVTPEPKIKFDYQINTATLTAQKNAGDYTGWVSTAKTQLDNIQKQLKDPSIDPLDALALQNEASAIQSNMDKYASYGGAFKKPKSSSTAKATGSFKTAGKTSIPKPKGISVKVPSANFKAPATRKLSVSKLPSNYLSKKIV